MHHLFLSVFSDSDIRFCVLSSLDERFDAHLAQAENLSALFVALNDEVDWKYRKIPKIKAPPCINLSKYKPPKPVTQKTLP